MTLPSSDLAFGTVPGDCSVDVTGLIATCNGSNLNPSGSAEFDLPVSAPHDAAAGDNQISAAVQPGAVSEGANTNPDSDQASVHIDNQADLGVTLANSPSSGIVAGQDSFTTAATVSNAGPSDSHAYSVTYSITGGSGLSFATGQPAGCSPSGATLVCSTNPDLTPSGAGSSTILPDVTISAGAAALGTYTINAAVAPTTSGVTDPTPGNDAGTATADVVGQADLGVTLANSPSSGIVAGQDSFTTAATVSNAGPSDSHAYSVTYSITGGSGLSFATGQPAGCGPSGATLVCSTNPDLTPSGPGSSAVLPAVTINAGTAALGTYTITAAVVPTTPGVTDPASGNDTGSDTAQVVSHADLSVTADGPGVAEIAGGPGFAYTLTVANGGPSDNHSDGLGKGYTVFLPLEPGVHFSSGAGCGAVSGGVSCSGPGLAWQGSKTFTVNVTTDPDIVPLASQVSGTDLTDIATVTLATVPGASDPNSGNNQDDATVHIDARADLALGVTTTHATGVTPPYVAGDSTNGAFSYVYTVTNHNGPSTHKGDFTVTDKLPVGFVFQTTAGCSATGDPATTGQTVTCTDSGSLAPGAQKIFTVGVQVDHYVTDGSYSDVNPTVATGATGTPEPSGTGANNSPAAVSVSVKTIANLQVTAMTASSQATLFANSDPANAVTFTLTYTNLGPSDTQGVSISSPPPGASTLPAFVFTPTSTGLMAPGDSTTVALSAKANPGLGHAPPATIVSGPFVGQDSLRVDPTSPTTDNALTNNVLAGVFSPGGITIDTVPSPVQNLSAANGNTNAVVSWKAPASNGGVALDATNPYQIKVMVGATLVRTIQVPTSAAQPCLGNTAGICFNVAGLTNNTTYTFDVQARNAVGLSDDRTTTATPSVNAQATIIPVATATTLTTCTTATASQSPVRPVRHPERCRRCGGRPGQRSADSRLLVRDGWMRG